MNLQLLTPPHSLANCSVQLFIVLKVKKFTRQKRLYKNIFVGTLDPRKLIEMNNFYMKISRITVVAS